MDRRLFLKSATAGVVAGSAGCGAALDGLPAPRAAVDLDSLLARLEEGMDEASRGHLMASLSPELAASRSPAARAHLARSEDLARKSIRSLMFSSAVRSMSPEQRSDPRVAVLAERMAPEMDETVEELTRALSEASAGQRQQVQQKLRERPDLPMVLAGKLDHRAAEVGVPRQARASLRAAAMDVSFRMRRQDPSGLIDEYLGKVERVRAVHGAQVEAERRLAARATSEAVWRSSGSGVVKTGLIMMGVGAGVFLASLSLGAATGQFGFVFGATLGVLVVLIGLIVLLVGGIIVAVSPDDEASHDEPSDGQRPDPQGLPCREDLECGEDGVCVSEHCRVRR